MARKEDFIQYKCAQWCRDNGILHHHSPNAGRRGLREANRLKAMGMRSGFHDLILFIKAPEVDLVEIKTKKGRIEDAQEVWHADILKKGYHSHHHLIVTDSADDAVRQLADIVAARLAAK